MNAVVVVGMLAAFGFAKRRARESEAPSDPGRCKILEAVSVQLGINEARLCRETGLTRSAVRHHLRFLVDAGVLRRVPVGRENHYFPAATAQIQMEQLAATSHGDARLVARLVLLEPGIPQAELAERLGMTRKVLRRYLDLLTDHGVIVEGRDSRILRYWPGETLDPIVHDCLGKGPESGMKNADPRDHALAPTGEGDLSKRSLRMRPKPPGPQGT